MRDCKKYPILNEYQLAQKKKKEKQKLFNEHLEKNGWKYKHLFMFGNKWSKDNDSFIQYSRGYLYNGKEIEEKELYKIVGFQYETED